MFLVQTFLQYSINVGNVPNCVTLNTFHLWISGFTALPDPLESLEQSATELKSRFGNRMAESRTTSSSEQQSSCSTGSGKMKQRQSFLAAIMSMPERPMLEEDP